MYLHKINKVDLNLPLSLQRYVYVIHLTPLESSIQVKDHSLDLRFGKLSNILTFIYGKLRKCITLYNNIKEEPNLV